MKSIKVLTKSLILTSLIVLSVPTAFAGDRHDNQQRYRSDHGKAAQFNRDRRGYRHYKQARRIKHDNRRLRRQLRKQRHYVRNHHRAERNVYGHRNYRGHSYWRYPLVSSYYISTPGYSVGVSYNDWNW